MIVGELNVGDLIQASPGGGHAPHPGGFMYVVADVRAWGTKERVQLFSIAPRKLRLDWYDGSTVRFECTVIAGFADAEG